MSLINRDLVAFGFRHLLKSKKFWAAVAVSAVPILAGFVFMISDIQDANRYGNDYNFSPAFTEWAMFFALAGTVPLLALLLAGGLLADEGQDRTLTYLLVRPIKRSTLYISKFIPVAAVLAGLVAIQILAFGLLRLLSLAIVDPGADVFVADGSGTVPAANVIGVMLPVAMLGGVLVGLAYCALFAFVSLVVQRYHFMVNLLVYLVWELPFGSTGGGAGFLTILFHGQSLLSRVDPTIDGLSDTSSHPVFAAIWLLGTIALWLWIGANRIGKQDFHITSAAT